MTSNATLVRCSWRIAAQYPKADTVEEMMNRSMRIAHTFHLSEDEHRLCAAEALRLGAELLAHDVLEVERNGWQN